MIHGPKSSCKTWTRLLLGAAIGGFLIVAGGATAAVPKPAAPVQGEAAEAAKLLVDAQAAAKNGNLRLALINLRKAVRIAPSSNTAHFQLGLVLYQTNDLGGAEREMRLAWKSGAPEKAVLPFLFQVMLARQEYQEILSQFPEPGTSTSPTTPDLLKARAFALQRLGRTPEALDAADRSLKLRRDGLGLLARASLSLQQGDVNSANKFADEALKVSPAGIEVALFKLRILRLLKDDAAAMALGNQLLAKFPGNLEVKFAHIEILLDQKQYPGAKAEIDAILAKRPGMQMATYYKALLMSRSGDARGAWDLALTLPKEFLEAVPGVGLAVAQMAMDGGRPDVAASTLGRVLGRDPGNLPARRRLASLYLGQGNANSALTVLAPVGNTSDPQVMRLLERIYTQLDRPKDAAAVLKKLAAVASANPQEVSRNALANIQAGRLDQAIKDLSEAAAKDPTNPALVVPLVGALAQAQQFAEASAVADKLAADPKQRATARILRGDILLRKRDLAGAEAAFNEAVKIEPGNRNALLSRARFYVAMQKYDGADRDLRAILTSNPKDSGALMQLADIAARQGRDPDVRSHLAKAIAAAPQEAGPRLTLARYLTDRGDLKGGLEQASNLVKLQPSNAVGLEFQGMTQRKMGQKNEAVASFRRLASLLPTSARAQVFLADALFSSGDRVGAVKSLDAAVDLAPKSPAVKRAQINLQLAMDQADQAVSSAQAFRKANPGPDGDLLAAETLIRTKHDDQAMEILSKSFSDKPSRAILSRYVPLAVTQNQNKRADDALASWLQQNPADVGARLEFANFYLSRKDTARAVAQYEGVLKRDPNNALAMNNLGSLLQSGNPGRASVLLTKAVQLAPNSPDINDSLGWLKVQQRDAAGGLSYLRRAHDLRPKDTAITYHLIVALDANAKRNDARALLKTLLASGGEFPDKQAALKLSSVWR